MSVFNIDLLDKKYPKCKRLIELIKPLGLHQEGDPRNFYDGRSISHLLRNNLLRVLKSATREPVVVVKFPVVYPS